MRLLITGASGQLGGYLLKNLNGYAESTVAWSGSKSGELFGQKLVPVDLANADALVAAFHQAQPAAIIHAAARASIAECYQFPERARQINVEATARLTELARNAGARLLYVSTDLVFDGAKGSYREEDEARPLSVYGRSKLAAEPIVLAASGNVVTRVSLLLGPSVVGRPQFFDQQVAALRAGRPVSLFTDEWRTPLGLDTAARALLAILKSNVTGLLHVGGPERLSRLEMGQRLAEQLDLDAGSLLPCLREDASSPEPRPCDTSLDSSRWRSLFPDLGRLPLQEFTSWRVRGRISRVSNRLMTSLPPLHLGLVRLTAVLSACLGWISVGRTAEDDSQFSKHVAPILSQRCVGCHNPRKKKGQLDLTTRKSLLAGGESGPGIVVGNAAKSLLIELVSGAEPRMPKQGARLTPAEIAALRQWIDRGAPWPAAQMLAPAKLASRVGPDWWSLHPLVRPTLPATSDPSWLRTPVDAFILARLEANGLKPSAPAPRRTLIRRVTFDLHGLPPTPEEVEAFLNDIRPDAYERLVDHLLASPRYGERWGRHWLDVVHYADTHGYDKDKRRDHAWPYRDYVIRSLSSDKPFNRFIKEQIAGDVLDPRDPEAIVATGFVAAGPWDFVGHAELREGTIEKEKTRLLDRDDMVSNTIGTFMSLTVHCARCHDHKFDPIPREEYYRLQAVFAGVDRGDRPRGPGPATTAADPLVYALVSHPPRPIHDLNRGDVEQPAELVKPGGLTCVPGLNPDFVLMNPADEGSRRLALASWVADPRNPLTWRSIVNRLWHYHFGKGIVDTPNDFGWNGSRPTHPELLDWLASEFLTADCSLRHLHRLILLSATYQQASSVRPGPAQVDGDNRLLWRMNRTRLDAEEVRDSVLAISGTLDQSMGGPGFALFRFKDDHSPVYDHSDRTKIDDPKNWRRTVYRFTVRSVPNPFLECLDSADPNQSTPVRNTTLTALQALAMLNDPFTLKQSEQFAQRLRREQRGLQAQVQAACNLAFGRLPGGEEKAVLADYARQHGLANMCRLLFNTNEFAFVD